MNTESEPQPKSSTLEPSLAPERQARDAPRCPVGTCYHRTAGAAHCSRLRQRPASATGRALLLSIAVLRTCTAADGRARGWAQSALGNRRRYLRGRDRSAGAAVVSARPQHSPRTGSHHTPFDVGETSVKKINNHTHATTTSAASRGAERRRRNTCRKSMPPAGTPAIARRHAPVHRVRARRLPAWQRGVQPPSALRRADGRAQQPHGALADLPRPHLGPIDNARGHPSLAAGGHRIVPVT